MYFGKYIHTFGFLYPLFCFYWNYCRNFQNERLTRGQFRVLADRVIDRLFRKWKDNKWDEVELNWICYCIYDNDSMLDPYNFTTILIAYVDHAKGCYILDL